MSEEYANLGTVRRRPRPGRQRPEPGFEPNGKSSGYSSGRANGTSGNGFGRAKYDDQPRSRRQASEDRDRPRDGGGDERQTKKKENLPWREIAAEAPLFRCPFDPWRLFGAVKRKGAAITLAGLALTLVGLVVGAWTVPYKMSLPLIRKTSNAVRSESALPNQFTPREYSDGTLYAFMKSPEVIRNTVERAKTNALLAPLHVTREQLADAVSIVPLPNPDWVFVKMKTFGEMPAMAALINIFGEEAVDNLRRIQRSESATINEYLQKQLEIANERIKETELEMAKLSDSGGAVSFDKETEQRLGDLSRLRLELATAQLDYGSIDAQLNALSKAVPNSRVAALEAELQEQLLSKQEAHPDIIGLRRKIELAKKQQESGEVILSGGGTDSLTSSRTDLILRKPKLEKQIADLTQRIHSLTNSLSAQSPKGMAFAVKKAELESRQKARDELWKAAREAQIYAEASLGYYGIREYATEKSIDRKNRWLKVGLMGLFFGFLGMLVTSGVALVGEALDTTLKTQEDIMRVCRLPVLATLGDLRKMSAKQQADWAFRTLTLLKGKLSRNADQALVCGIISADHGEGRSTWVNLLVNAASQRGLRVLTVDTRPAAAAPASAPAAKPEMPKPAEKPSNGAGETNGKHAINLPDEPSLPLVKDPLGSPEKIAEQLQGASAQPLVHIPLPGWVWSLERRKQWQNALESWKHVDNLVIFVELPPASESEAVLLAENLPQVIWLVGSGMPDAAETAMHLDTLRHAHCNLVGAVLNHAPPPFLSLKIGRWLNPVAALAILASLLCFNTAAADGASPQAELQPAIATANNAPLAFSAVAKRERAKWQERLTFGPGDTVDIHFYGNNALSRTNVFIGPDGRLNYLEANGINAAGLTVDELRKKLDDTLSPLYQTPVRTIVIPVTFASKKYFMLGKINTKGAFTLDRPLTLVEAVARAKGLETGLYRQTTVEMADLGHSFIVREGAKLPVDFEKLFQQGDLTQNIQIEPNDYIYFASTSARDIYVVGEVMNPGPLGFVEHASVISAITDRGGFTDRAFKRRVLVVRGSLNEPETFVINTDSALDAYLRDFRLQPKDIVYVSRRPWVKAEELLDEAASSFIQGAVTTWAGVNVGPIIKSRLLPRTRPR